MFTRAIDVVKAELPAIGTVTEQLMSDNVEHALVKVDPINLSGKKTKTLFI